MKRVFEYQTIALRSLAWAHLGAELAGGIEERAHAGGGALYGIWAGQIGLARDEGIIMTAWPSFQDADNHAHIAVAHPDVVISNPVRLEATVRPTRDQQPRRGGFYAHRWFELDRHNWDEFLALSTQAWPPMEAAINARILGFWREVSDPQAQTVKVLLLTWYAALSDWEASRWWGRPDPKAQAATTRFARRSELVHRTSVLISTVPPAWTSER